MGPGDGAGGAAELGAGTGPGGGGGAHSHGRRAAEGAGVRHPGGDFPGLVWSAGVCVAAGAAAHAAYAAPVRTVGGDPEGEYPGLAGAGAGVQRAAGSGAGGAKMLGIDTTLEMVCIAKKSIYSEA